MNFVGKFDAKLPVDGPIAHSAMHAHVDGASAHAPSDAIIVPDAQLLFGGEFKRSGVDLVLSDDHHELVLHDYFKGEKRVALASPDGAHLTGALVNALAGHVEYAQADGAAAAAAVVGHVTKLTGSATAIRNGVSIILNQGDNIDKGDVLQSAADSTLGVTFIDGTVFGLSSNARMVVNEMIYDPNGSNNSSLLSLVAGTISFVAGETAKHGDMKVDTPVATMGIRGTAVLVEIDFDVPGQNGAPSANFQVLVEPDGTTGSYILFDKNTLAPLATVNTAGTLTKISQGIVSFESGSPLTSDQQKLITDLFTTKFGDSNTKSLFDHFTDSIVPQSLQPVYLPGGVTVTPIVLLATNPLGPSLFAASLPAPSEAHIPGAPHVNIFNQSFSETAGVTGSHTPHTLSAPITFTDPNSGDRPTVTVAFTSFTYQNAQHNDITASLSPQEQAAIAAVEGISLQTAPGNNNDGSAIWTYSFPDGAFDFLGAGETLTLTYTASVNNNYASDQQTGTAKFTIIITGTNDVPVITSNVPQTIVLAGGTHTKGGDLTAHVPTSGTIAFDDPDLTDTHTVSVNLVTTGLPTVPQTILDEFKHALTVSIATDSTGTGFGTVNWQLADLPVYLADFIPKGETVTLTYAVTVTDSQGATATQDITVTITGKNAPAVVWIATTTTGSTPGGLWGDGANWETGAAPTINDKVIIVTDQLIGLTPSYPVTIDAPAEAKSLKIDNFGASAPKLINQSTLTIAGALYMTDHWIPDSDSTTKHTRPELINQGMLTVGGEFDIFADSVVHNWGTISVGGLLEVLGGDQILDNGEHFLEKSVLHNSGTITLSEGGDFGDLSRIKNTGTIEVSGGTLTVETDIANTHGTIVVGGPGTLALDSGAIDGGTINNFGHIAVFGFSAIRGAYLNYGDVTIGSHATLTLDGDTVTGTSFIDKAGSSVIQVDDGTTLKLSGVHITGGVINDGTAEDAGGNIDVIGDSKISGAHLNNGDVTLSGTRLTLDNDTVTGTSFTDGAEGSVIQVDDHTTLTLSGVYIIGGAINDGSDEGAGGNIDVTGDSTISGAHLNYGHVTLSGTTLTLDGDTVTGTSFTDTIGGSVIQVGDDTTLKLSGVHITGGAINDGTADGGGGNIDVTADSTISGASLNYGHVTIAGGATLTLDDGATIASGTLTIDRHGVLDVVHGTAGAAVTLDGSVTNSGLLEASGGGTLHLDGNVSNNGTIEANGGTVVVGADASISGSSGFVTVTITNNGLADFVGSTQPLALNATFSGHGILELDNSQHYGGTVSGFGAGDKIDLIDLNYSPIETDVWNGQTHTLTITNGTQSSSIVFAGSYNQNSFALTDDGGHTEVVLSPAQASVSGLDHAGNAVEGFALDATLTDASGVTYQWLDNGTQIATGPIYTPTAADLGKTLDVVVGFTDHGIAEHVTALAGTVVAPPAVAINADGTTVNENASLTLNGLDVSFGDAHHDSITVTLDVIHGTLALESTSGLSESGSGTSLSLTGTLTDIDAALHSGLVYTPTTGYYGSDTLTFEAHDGAFTSNTATATIDVAPLPPVLNSMTLDVVQGGTELLTNADFSVTDPNGSNFLYTVSGVTGGQFEFFNGDKWVSAPADGFTTAEIAAGQVEFVQDGSLTTPQFSISAADSTSHTVSAAITPTVSFAAAPAAALDFDGHSAAIGAVATSHVGNAAGGDADGITLQGSVDWSGQSSVGSNQLLFYNGSTSDAGFGLEGVVTANGLDLQIQHGGSDATNMNVTLSAGQWYDLALTHVNGMFTLYVDGVAEYTGTQDVGGIPGSSADNTLVGGNVDANGGVNEGFYGSIADVGVWNAALTQSQIQANEFVSPPQGNESGLAAYFPLNDGSGTTAHDATNSAGNLSVTGAAPVWQTAAHSIAGGGTLELSGAIASDQAVAFQGPTGSLILDAPASFDGVISGFTGDGTLSGSDQIDLKGIDYNLQSTFTDSYNATTDTLSVSDGTNSAVLHFNGVYQLANFSFTTDNNGGTIVYDPPVTDHSAAKTQAVTATNHGFVFNFADHGNGANGVHPAGDTHIFDGQTFVNAEADLNQHHDDGHGHTAPAFDSLDTATIAAIKAQLHAHDFHFV